VQEYRGVTVDEFLDIDIDQPAADAAQTPLLCGVEIIVDQR
jgi:hypothetical protein